MAPDQDRHRDKRLKAVEEIGGSPTSSATPPASRPNAQPGTPPIPLDSLSNSSPLNNIHPFAAPQSHLSRRGANAGFTHDTVDFSASKGKEIALPVRERVNRGLETINEDAEMGDVPEEDTGKSDHHKMKDDSIDSSASKGKGRALGTPEGSSTEVSHGAQDGNGGSARDDDMGNYDDERLNHDDRDYEEDEEEDDNDDSSGTDAPGSTSMGGHGVLIQIPWVEPKHPPTQELRPRKDGTFDVRPEGS